MTRLLDQEFPQICSTTTMGTSSLIVMSKCMPFQESGQHAETQWPSKYAPKPMPPDASVWRCKHGLSSHSRLMKQLIPLQCFRNCCHTATSANIALETLMWCRGNNTPQVASIKRRKKAQPGATARQAKLSFPINFCSSRKVIFLLEKAKKPFTTSVRSFIFSWGRRTSIATVSNTRPRNFKHVKGPYTLLVANRTLRQQKNKLLSPHQAIAVPCQNPVD